MLIIADLDFKEEAKRGWEDHTAVQHTQVSGEALVLRCRVVEAEGTRLGYGPQRAVVAVCRRRIMKQEYIKQMRQRSHFIAIENELVPEYTWST